MTNLDIFKPTNLVGLTSHWKALDEDRRRTYTLNLLQARNEAVTDSEGTTYPAREALWGLTLAHLALKGTKKGRVSKNTQATYRRGVLDLLELWREENLLRASRDAGDQLISDMLTPTEEGGMGYSVSTTRVKLAAFKAFYRALRWAGVFDMQKPEDRDKNADPFKDVKVGTDPTAPEDKRDAYTDAEIYQLVETAKRRDQDYDLAVILLGAHAGLRKAEMLALKWEHVNFADRVLMVVNGKGGKDRKVGMSQALSDVLTRLREPTGYVLPFRSSTRIYERLDRLAFYAKLPAGSIRHRGVHGLRHSAGTRMYRETRDLHRVAAFLGHSQIQTSARYAKLDEKREVNEIVSGWTVEAPQPAAHS